MKNLTWKDILIIIKEMFELNQKEIADHLGNNVATISRLNNNKTGKLSLKNDKIYEMLFDLNGYKSPAKTLNCAKNERDLLSILKDIIEKHGFKNVMEDIWTDEEEGYKDGDYKKFVITMLERTKNNHNLSDKKNDASLDTIEIIKENTEKSTKIIGEAEEEILSDKESSVLCNTRVQEQDLEVDDVLRGLIRLNNINRNLHTLQESIDAKGNPELSDICADYLKLKEIYTPLSTLFNSYHSSRYQLSINETLKYHSEIRDYFSKTTFHYNNLNQAIQEYMGIFEDISNPHLSVFDELEYVSNEEEIFENVEEILSLIKKFEKEIFANIEEILNLNEEFEDKLVEEYYEEIQNEPAAND